MFAIGDGVDSVDRTHVTPHPQNEFLCPSSITELGNELRKSRQAAHNVTDNRNDISDEFIRKDRVQVTCFACKWNDGSGTLLVFNILRRNRRKNLIERRDQISCNTRSNDITNNGTTV